MWWNRPRAVMDASDTKEADRSKLIETSVIQTCLAAEFLANYGLLEGIEDRKR